MRASPFFGRVLFPAAAAAVLAAVGLAQKTRPATEPTFLQIDVPGHREAARVWPNRGPNGEPGPHYALSLDGTNYTAPQATSYDLLLRYRRFDPRREGVSVPASLRARPASRLRVVQYWTEGLESYREVLRDAGVTIHQFLANHANVVEMDAATAARVRQLPFVRAVRPYHPAFKLEEELLAGIVAGERGPIRVNLLTQVRGPAGQDPVSAWVESVGGRVEDVSPQTYLMSVTVGYEQLPELAALDQVQWIDRWSAPEVAVDVARVFHGANYVESIGNYLGQGVNVEVMDGGVELSHPDLQNFIQHSPVVRPRPHGTATSGIVLGDGTGNFTARGLAPAARLVAADFGSFSGGDRYAHSAELVDPNLPYQANLESNSWGSAATNQYNSVSQTLDTILFDITRLTITQAQGNNNGEQAFPQAWAKNIISVGGINHLGTATKADDFWGGASIGPATDGRIKPDLASFYDGVLCTDMVGTAGYSPTSYYDSFSGTSAATAITSGAAAIFLQMWSDGLFGNPTPGSTPFENAPQNTTVKAFLINTATPWFFDGLNHNLTRTHQGWGHVDLQRMYDMRDQIYVVDETDVLVPKQSRTHSFTVGAGTPEFRATLVFRDPPGNPASTKQRINDMDLTVLSPSGTLYYGNYGLRLSNESLPYGVRNTSDTVENVWVKNPEPGDWRVIVSAAQLNQDNHVETGALDADYALVCSGFDTAIGCPPSASVTTRTGPDNINTYTADPPVIGTTMNLTVSDTMGYPKATFLGFMRPANTTVSFITGTILIQSGGLVWFNSGPIEGPSAVYQVPIPNIPSLCGVSLYTQVLLSGAGLALTNSQDLHVGY